MIEWSKEMTNLAIEVAEEDARDYPDHINSIAGRLINHGHLDAMGALRWVAKMQQEAK